MTARKYQRQWDAFRRRRHDLLSLLLRWAFRDLGAGARRISVKAYWERLRAMGVERQLNNTFTSYAARWLIAQDRRLAKVIELRGAA